MRTAFTPLALFAALFVCSAAAADDAQAIVDKALEAAGGKAALSKFQATTFKETGTYYGMGAGLPYTGEYAVEHPGKFKMNIAGAFIMIVDGDKGWTSMGGMTTELPADQVAEQKELRYASRIEALRAFSDGDKLTLAAVGESKLDDQTVVGVKVTSPGHRDVTLYFDKETGLLAKSEYRAKADELGGQEMTYTGTFEEYETVEGLKVATKVTIKRDGMDFVDGKLSEIKLSESLDANVFAKP